jgi:hypothetical protein
MPIIHIDFDDEGNMYADYKGFQGKMCDFSEQKLMKLLKDGLEIKKKSEKRKKEKVGEKIHA